MILWNNKNDKLDEFNKLIEIKEFNSQNPYQTVANMNQNKILNNISNTSLSPTRTFLNHSVMNKTKYGTIVETQDTYFKGFKSSSVV